MIKRRLAPRVQRAKEYVAGEDQALPAAPPSRITNETVAKSREEILGFAKRFIYPLKHPKHKIALYSTILIVAVFLFFIFFSGLMLYRFQSTGEFAYRVTQILPVPVARVDGRIVKYEEYLFYLRNSIHYLSTQETVNFGSTEGKKVLDDLRSRAMQRVKENAIIAKLAGQKKVRVTDQEVEAQIDLIRSQGGLGESKEALENTLRDYYGWDIDDLRRVLRVQLLKQKLTPLVDNQARPRAEQALGRVRGGEPFDAVAKEMSDDPLTKESGGVFNDLVTSTNEILPPQFIETVFKLQQGQISDIIDTNLGLNIVHVIEKKSETEAKVAHIFFKYNDINAYTQQRLGEIKVNQFINVQPPSGGAQGIPQPTL